MPKLRLSIGILVLALLATAGAHGETIGPICGSCFGGVYTLSETLVSSSGGEETWEITYTLDLAGYIGSATYVSALAAKVVSGPNLLGVASTFTAPTSGAWTQTSGNINNSGCDGSGGGWVCLAWNSGDQLLVGAGHDPYSWVFDVTIKAGTLIVPGINTGPSIQANFDPPPGQLLSEQVTVPEPSGNELWLGVAGLFVVYRRKLARLLTAQ